MATIKATEGAARDLARAMCEQMMKLDTTGWPALIAASIDRCISIAETSTSIERMKERMRALKDAALTAAAPEPPSIGEIEVLADNLLQVAVAAGIVEII